MEKAYPDIHREIVEMSQLGNQKAQYKLYQLYSKAMYNICYRMMNSKEEAEDMLQESFLDAFRKLRSFRFESSIGAWLKQIVVNRCINEIKRKKTDLVLMGEMSAFDSPEPEENEPNLKLEVKKVLRAIEQLADGYRVIFSLYQLEGYDHVEIAQILGISEGTSKSQYMRAKAKIKDILLTQQL